VPFINGGTLEDELVWTVEDQDVDIGHAMFHVAFSGPSRDGEIDFALESPEYKG
jgi:hypothetical protein